MSRRPGRCRPPPCSRPRSIGSGPRVRRHWRILRRGSSVRARPKRNSKRSSGQRPRRPGGETSEQAAAGTNQRPGTRGHRTGSPRRHRRRGAEGGRAVPDLLHGHDSEQEHPGRLLPERPPVLRLVPPGPPPGPQGNQVVPCLRVHRGARPDARGPLGQAAPGHDPDALRLADRRPGRRAQPRPGRPRAEARGEEGKDAGLGRGRGVSS